MLGSPMSQHIWSPNWERVPGSSSTLWVRLQRLQLGIPLIIQRQTQTNIIINLWANCQLVFLLMLFVLSCKTWNVAKPGLGWSGPLQGLNNPRFLPQSQDFSSVLSMVCKSCTHSRQSLPVRTVSMQVRSKVRGLLCFVSEA